MAEQVLDSYTITADNVSVKITIKRTPEELVPIYHVETTKIEEGTIALLDQIREMMVAKIPIKPSELLDPAAMEKLKKRFYLKGLDLIKKELPSIHENVRKYLIGLLIHEMLGLGKLELLLSDDKLEEVVVNNSVESVWVYHKTFGWLKTNVVIDTENEILNYAASVGRRVGKQITMMNPLMDAHLITGDRVNATLFPISTKGNTMTIRKFRRQPWTITDLLINRTISIEVASLLWLSMQYEMNMIVAGGTASGKTSFLNSFLPFIQPNQRIISIEDTRELMLPSFLHWIPMTTREANPEGKGGISMLDLLINSLRMRPDRIVVGEIRRAREAEVLFEAMLTGHSVYATIHAETADQAYRRLTNPPINVPEIMLESLHLIAVCFRDRRLGVRKILQVAEIISSDKSMGKPTNVLYRWKPSKDKIIQENQSFRLMTELRVNTGLSDKELKDDLTNKSKILEWFVKNKINTVDAIGRAIAIIDRGTKTTTK